MVCTVGTFDTDMVNKLIKIMFNKYFKIPRWHYPNFNFNFTVLKMKNKNRNLRFSLHLCVLLGNQTQNHLLIFLS